MTNDRVSYIKFNCLLALLISTCNFSLAQNKGKTGIIKADSITFVATEGARNILWVSNSTNPDRNKFNARTLTQLPYYRTILKDAETAVFNRVFSPDRLKQLLPELNMSFQIYYNAQGRVKYIYYLVRKNTLITPAELQRLELALKKYMVLDVPDEYRNMGDIWPVTYIYRFKKQVIVHINSDY